VEVYFYFGLMNALLLGGGTRFKHTKGSADSTQTIAKLTPAGTDQCGSLRNAGESIESTNVMRSFITRRNPRVSCRWANNDRCATRKIPGFMPKMTMEFNAQHQRIARFAGW
jgi:hypothetical protein